MSKKNRPAEGTTIELTVEERMQLLTILPPEGSLATMRIVRDLQAQVGFSAKEFQAIGVKEERQAEHTTMTWDVTKARPKRLTFAGFAVALIVGRLQKLDKEEKLNKGHISLYEKFVGTNGATPQ